MRNFPTITPPNSLSPPWGKSGQNLLRPRLETESMRQLSCDVVFGSPSADCMGTGVCRITARTGASPTAQERKQHCRSTVGLFFPIEGGKGVSLILTRALLCSKLYKTHLRHGALILETPCQLPRSLSQTLGLKINELSVGTYPIQENDGFLRIDFMLTNRQ